MGREGNGTKSKSTVRQRSTAIAKRAQPHGGALNIGGTPGNKGGPGKLPEVLRIRSRAVYDKWLDWAEKKADEKLADDAAIPDELMMQIGNTAGRYGFPPGDSVSLDEIRERLARQLEAIGATLPASDAEKVIAAIRPVWAAA